MLLEWKKEVNYIDTICLRIEKVVKKLLFLYDQENPPSSCRKESTQIDVDDLEPNIYGEYGDPSDSPLSEHEVDKYLNDCLVWYSKIARDILVIQVSTVSYESGFSSGSRLLDSNKRSLHPRMVEALTCSRDCLLANHVSLNMDEECKEEMEHLLHSQIIVVDKLFKFHLFICL